MKIIILCGIDGVLADCEHRLEYLKNKDYNNFYGATMAEDSPIQSGIELISALRLHSYECALWFLTGRPERTRDITMLWIKGKTGLLFNEERLLMRADDDHRPALEVKVEQVRTILEPNNSTLVGRLEKIGDTVRKALGGHTDQTLCYFVDDDPKNVKAVCKAFPEITGIVFGVKRMD